MHCLRCDSACSSAGQTTTTSGTTVGTRRLRRSACMRVVPTAYSQTVTAACCDDPSAPCVAGLPTTCSITCADVLLPMQTACGTFLTMIGMQATIDAAVATCPAPLAPCGSYPEFMAYSQTVTAACCDDPSAPCVAGLPTSCSVACAAVLLPM